MRKWLDRYLFIKRRLLYYWQFVPFKRNGVLFALVSLAFIWYLKENFYTDDSSFKPYLELFLWVMGVFAAFIIGLGFLYTIGCYIYFLLRKNRQDDAAPELKIGLEDGTKGTAGWVPAQLFFSNVLMPLMGYVKVRMVYNNQELSDAIVLNSYTSGFKDVTRKGGSRSLWLSERKVYQIKGYIIVFEDYLQFFSFPLFQRIAKSFYLTSPDSDTPVPDIPPSKTREMTEKVKTLKKVQGDFFNYKDFESGDDVRRIVWKIFAKNKELVVRIPEVINPYASHLNFYCSFQNGLSKDMDGKFTRGMLDLYKDVVDNTCRTLQKGGRKIELTLDQEIPDLMQVEQKDRIDFMLSSANWQQDSSLDNLPVQKGDSILCVSSLVPAETLEAFINRHPVNICLVNVSQYMAGERLFHWENLLFRNTGKSNTKKLAWLLSGFRRKLKRNERKLAEITASEQFHGIVI